MPPARRRDTALAAMSRIRHMGMLVLGGEEEPGYDADPHERSEANRCSGVRI